MIPLARPHPGIWSPCPQRVAEPRCLETRRRIETQQHPALSPSVSKEVGHRSGCVQTVCEGTRLASLCGLGVNTPDGVRTTHRTTPPRVVARARLSAGMPRQRGSFKLVDRPDDFIRLG